MPNRLIGHRTALGTVDTQGVNPYLPGTGWVVTIGPDLIASNLPEIEIYHVALDGPIGSSANWLIDAAPWDFVNQGWANGWDPSQPVLLLQSNYIQFCWNVAFTTGPYNKTTNIQPTVTLWLRHELQPPQPILPGLGG